MAEQPPITNHITSALKEAEVIINGAKERAQEILKFAEKQAEQIKYDAYNEGIQFGKKEVIAASLKFLRDHEVLSRKLQREATNLAFEIIKKVFNYEDRSIIDPIHELAKKLFESSGAERAITLLINPINSERVAALANHINSLSGLKFILKESIEISGDTLVMRSELGEVQVSLSDLLNELAQFLDIRRSN